MWSRSSGYYVFAVVCFTVVGTLPQAQETRKNGNNSHRGRRPHIVFLLQDDLGVNRPKLVVKNLTPCSLNTVMHQSVLSLTGWADVGFNNPNSVQFSPTLTRMAREGLLLTNHYVHFHCSPTRRSFLTGLFAT